MPVSKQDRFLSLYEPVHNRFERFCRARVYGKMEFRDLMNETLLVAFEKFDSLRSEAAFLSFIIGISIRILANNSKKKQEDYLNKEEHALLIANHGNATSLDTEIHFLHQALALLPNEQQESIILFEIAGFSIREIAEMHNASEDAVKQRLKRGRAKLAEILTFESSLKTGEPDHG
ncbi:MAG: hypothetical protein A3D31_15545 [Candidatus Fluviicola riflensis]|nr:MAG: hypothetical protein CHH17_00480 [Candidatus Fluviicola riflensis]OGS78373.1 MAG: hypothetical protein A3D31_15545 [Candidatus Fluviicola riflensis]OGS85439.1 MAG: hypothetical protein A2724_12480 [Fluviicola sp. RIFCSPHIGHO2_01_FULL_43_53]OGS87481.1 MAG: hypothetical protein A3E30_08900 [Fluviicola sp. RIFCSPHIGHO2_12_FULL_43_24]